MKKADDIMVYWLLITFIIFPLIYFILQELIKLYTHGNPDILADKIRGVFASFKSLTRYRLSLYKKGDDGHGENRNSPL
jgi:hypothetical protein